GEAKNRYLFPETPLPFDYLRLVDLDWDLDAEEVIGRNFVLRDFDLDFVLSNGILRTTGGRVTYTGGSVTSEFMIDTSRPTPLVRLKYSADDIDIRDILEHLHRPLILEGRLTAVADLQSTGTTPRELASALNGDFASAIEGGKIRRIANLLASDALDLVTTIPAMTVPDLPVPGMQEYADLNCMAFRFIFEDGVGKSEVIFLDTRDLRIRGAGVIDLGSETVDLVVAPRPKKRRLSMTSSVRISGPLANPSKRKIPIQEAAQLAGEVLAPYIFLPARGLGYLWYLIRTDKDQRAPCRELAPPVE
ncbi:MAG: AsmA family protein, partial [Candidatus Hydrogenedentota bacterium]